jgi:hypothetical protein
MISMSRCAIHAIPKWTRPTASQVTECDSTLPMQRGERDDHIHHTSEWHTTLPTAPMAVNVPRHHLQFSRVRSHVLKRAYGHMVT